jgi:hypothetical protein
LILCKHRIYDLFTVFRASAGRPAPDGGIDHGGAYDGVAPFGSERSMAGLSVQRSGSLRPAAAGRATRLPSVSPSEAAAAAAPTGTATAVAVRIPVEPASPPVGVRPRQEGAEAALALALERRVAIEQGGVVDAAAAATASRAYRSRGAAPSLDGPEPLLLSVRV